MRMGYAVLIVPKHPLVVEILKATAEDMRIHLSHTLIIYYHLNCKALGGAIFKCMESKSGKLPWINFLNGNKFV